MGSCLPIARRSRPASLSEKPATSSCDLHHRLVDDDAQRLTQQMLQLRQVVRDRPAASMMLMKSSIMRALIVLTIEAFNAAVVLH